MSLRTIATTVSGIAGLASGFFGQGNRKGENADFKGMNLNKFISLTDKQGGLYKPNLFVVEILPGDGFWARPNPAAAKANGARMVGALQGGGLSQPTPKPAPIEELDTLRFLCNSASLPGVQIITSDHRRQNQGTFDRRPFGVQVTDIPLTFMLDNKGDVLRFFNNWTQNIIHYQNPGDEHAVTPSGAQLFEVEYRKKYLCAIRITCFDHNSNEVVQYTLYEAFPIQVGDITVAWSETDSFSILPVQFTFRTYMTNQIPVPQVSGASRPFSIGETLGIIAGAAGMIGSFQKPTSIGSALNIVNNVKLFSF